MAYAKINSITNANMAKVSSIAKAAISKISSIDAPVTGFTNTYSLNVDGVDDHMLIASGFKSGATTSSSSLWFKKSTALNDDMVLGAHANLYSWIDSGNRVRIYHPLYGNTGTFAHTLTGDEVTGWNHLVVTYDQAAGEMKLYVNGNLKDTNSTSVSVHAGYSPCYIGRLSTGTWGIFGGNLDEVGNWSSVLTAAEVTALYNSGTPIALDSDSGDYASSGNLDGYWRMGDGATYPTIPDDSANSNDGTMTNMVEADIVSDVPGGGD